MWRIPQRKAMLLALKLHFFHATIADLKLLRPRLTHTRNVCGQQTEIDLEFDRLRPPAISIARSTALFAGDDPEFCAAYLVAENKNVGTPIRIYRVLMTNSSRHPMCLVSYARHFLDDRELLAKIISEYWKPLRIGNAGNTSPHQ